MDTTLDVKALLASRAAGQTQRPSTAVAKDDDLQYDLGLLSAYDPAPVDGAALKVDGDAALLRWRTCSCCRTGCTGCSRTSITRR